MYSFAHNKQIKQFYFKRLNLASVSFWTCFNCQIVLFDSLIRPYQVLQLRARVNVGTMARRRCPTFTKAPKLEPHHKIVWCHIQDTPWGGVLSSAEMQSVYSTVPADWANDKQKKFHTQWPGQEEPEKNNWISINSNRKPCHKELSVKCPSKNWKYDGNSRYMLC